MMIGGLTPLTPSANRSAGGRSVAAVAFETALQRVVQTFAADADLDPIEPSALQQMCRYLKTAFHQSHDEHCALVDIQDAVHLLEQLLREYIECRLDEAELVGLSAAGAVSVVTPAGVPHAVHPPRQPTASGSAAVPAFVEASANISAALSATAPANASASQAPSAAVLSKSAPLAITAAPATSYPQGAPGLVQLAMPADAGGVGAARRVVGAGSTDVNGVYELARDRSYLGAPVYQRMSASGAILSIRRTPTPDAAPAWAIVSAPPSAPERITRTFYVAHSHRDVESGGPPSAGWAPAPYGVAPGPTVQKLR
jgi:hypothetical protein